MSVLTKESKENSGDEVRVASDIQIMQGLVGQWKDCGFYSN